MKFRPLIFRNARSYLPADRVEDLTREEIRTSQDKCNWTVTLYSYLSGTNLPSGIKIHVLGIGDVDMNVEILETYVPPQSLKAKNAARAKMVDSNASCGSTFMAVSREGTPKVRSVCISWYPPAC